VISKKNISIGTANFGRIYGISQKKLSINEISKILKDCKKKKIKFIDTANNYGSAERILGRFDLSNFRVCSKIPKIPTKKKNIEKWIINKVEESLSKLKIKKFHGIYLHDESDLLGKNKETIYSSLFNLKKKGYTKKIGISIYDFNSLNKILKRFKLDIVQLPINLFDRRLLTKNTLSMIKRKKIEIYARSIFLQGILLYDKKKIDKKFLNKDKILFNLWHEWLKKNRKKQLDVCLSFLKEIKEINNIIVGVNNVKQFRMILNSLNKKTIYPKKIYTFNKKIIDIRQW
jgi:hypothetical protein|tara:strand:- start:518 stop:1381 length:864 start_codon:yes stop_codon:yes gene_type:complete